MATQILETIKNPESELDENVTAFSNYIKLILYLLAHSYFEIGDQAVLEEIVREEINIIIKSQDPDYFSLNDTWDQIRVETLVSIEEYGGKNAPEIDLKQILLQEIQNEDGPQDPYLKIEMQLF